MYAIELRFLGPPQIMRDGQPVTVQRRKSLALLAYLAVSQQGHTRDELATLLWPDLDQSHGHMVLRSVLADLHRTLGAELLSLSGDRVTLCCGPDITVDVLRFRAFVTQAAEHHPTSRSLCEACVAALNEAVVLYQANFLAGFTLADAVEFDAWQTIQTETLCLELASVLEKLAYGLAEWGRYDDAINAARRWLTHDPLNEAAHRALIEFHGRAGDRAAAARQFTECARILQAELGVAPGPETAALHEAVRAGRGGALSAAPASPPAPLADLPADPTPFIGRQAELRLLAERLADPACRLLTVLGPGGIGKTRLAIQAARRAREQFRQAVCFVDLAPLASAELLSTAILRQVHAPRGAAEPDAYLLDYLTDKQILLVLDNYEHLLSGPESDRRDGYGLVTKLVTAAPDVKLLITSRSRLNVRAEWLAPLGGMQIPQDLDCRDDLNHPLSPQQATEVVTADLEHCSATSLFLACVRRIRPDFQPTEADAPCIVRICQLLGGMPLAIELAAAWTRTLGLAEIERELASGLALLQSTARDAPPRHRSMTAAFDHSWRLLAPRQRSILRQLAVFRGGFTREAAHAVTGATMADLASLADASWLWLAPSGRYEIHELTRQYCAEKLAAEHERELGETPDRVRDRHAAHFLAYLKTQPEAVSTWQDRFQPLLPDGDNFNEIWRRSIARGEFEKLRDLLAIVSYEDASVHAKFQLLEPAQRMLQARLATEAAGPQRAEAAVFMARLLLRRARCYWQVGKLAQAAADITGGLRLLESLPHTPGRSETRLNLRMIQARLQDDLGDFTAAIPLRSELLAELPQIQAELWPYQPDRALPYWQAEIISASFHSFYRLGRYEEAERATRQGLQLFAAMPWACNAIALVNLGTIHFLRGEYDAALRLGIESLHANQAHGQQAFGLVSLLAMAQAEAALGRLAEARGHYQRVQTAARALDRPALFVRSLAGLADLDLTLGRPAKARETFAEMRAFCAQNALEWGELLALAWVGSGRAALALGDRPAAEAAFGRALRCRDRFAITTLEAIAGLAQAHATGARGVELAAFAAAHPAASFSVRQAMARLLAECAAESPADQFAAMTERGRARELNQLIDELALNVD